VAIVQHFTDAIKNWLQGSLAESRSHPGPRLAAAGTVRRSVGETLVESGKPCGVVAHSRAVPHTGGSEPRVHTAPEHLAHGLSWSDVFACIPAGASDDNDTDILLRLVADAREVLPTLSMSAAKTAIAPWRAALRQ
jgi:hypothetical protein